MNAVVLLLDMQALASWQCKPCRHTGPMSLACTHTHTLFEEIHSVTIARGVRVLVDSVESTSDGRLQFGL